MLLLIALMITGGGYTHAHDADPPNTDSKLNTAQSLRRVRNHPDSATILEKIGMAELRKGAVQQYQPDPHPAFIAPGPICSMPEPLLWLRADMGFSAGTWLDQTSNARHGTNTGSPTLLNNALNFNPAVRYNGADQTYSNVPELVWVNGTHHLTIFAVYVPANNNNNMGVFGNQGNGGTNNTMLYNGIIGDGAGPAPDYPVPGLYGARPHLLSYVVDEESNVAGTPNASAAWNRGALQVAFPYDENNISQLIPNMHVGRSGTHASSQYFTGEIAEFIIFERSNGSLSLTTDQRFRMESYLAMKYGLTLVHDYFLADNTLIWNTVTNGGYNDRVTVIGRDDCYPLQQRKSLSAETGALVTIAHTASGGAFSTPDAFPVDQRFLLFGDDNGALTLTDNIGSQPNRKLGRDWKVMENGAVGNVTLSVPSASLPASLTHLMVYADPGNPHVGAIYYPLTTVGSDRRVQVDLVSGRYFSFVSYDNDRDGIDDGTDLDDDNDGIPDTAEGGDLLDTDGDGIPNRFDLDSDNDGIFDVVEALNGQPHSNGVLNGPVTAFGIPTSVDADANNVVDYTIRDSDLDGTIDSMELDSDNDGCRDVIEAGYADSNNDGELGPIPLTVDGSGRVTSGGP